MTSETLPTFTGSPGDVSFVEQPAPRVSVVILAWKLTEQLLVCLDSLRQSVGAPAFEVQLVLNGADAGVREIVAKSVVGANIIDLPVNAGFGGGCNAGAATARGEFVLFLNDDTVVPPTWMASLVQAADDAPRAGAIASVLLNSDGTIQEGGSRVLQSAATVQFGKGMTVAAAEAAHLLGDREIDYGSGAALLVRRSIFETVQGFDPLFEPAYFEDVDLCFRLRQAGAGVRLAGAARVLHLSGESTKDNRRFREFASWRSGLRFIQRWASTLEHAPLADAPPGELCDPGRWTGPVRPTQPTPFSLESKALSIASDYAQWLATRLDQVQDALTVTEAALAATHTSVDDAHDRLRVALARLEDLDSRGPIGIVKWKVGAAANRRSKRRTSQ